MKRKNKSMSEVLKRAIKDSGLSFTAIEERTGVKRASVMRFMRGETSLRLDVAEKLAELFDLELRKKGR